ncbi:MAG: P-loop NTPase [Planctomycetota bacterium]
MAIDSETVLTALQQVPAPGTDEDIVAAGYVRDLDARPDGIRFRLELPGPLTPARMALAEKIEAALSPLGTSVELSVDPKIPASYVGGDGALAPGVKNFIAVGSGKGGVGKSTVSANLAAGLAKAGARVGLLDADVYGPSVPLLFGVPRRAFVEEMQLRADQCQPGETPELRPYLKHGVYTMSLGYLVDPDQAAIWRGPMVHGALQQLLRDVKWGELDYLVIDMPPGTGDAQLTLTQVIQLAGAVVVCTPQPVAIADARKAKQMFEKTRTKVLGVVENMTGPVFGEGGARDEAEEWGVPFLGGLPLTADVRVSGDQGIPVLAQDEPTGELADALWGVVDRLTAGLAKEARARPRSLPVSRS